MKPQKMLLIIFSSLIVISLGFIVYHLQSTTEEQADLQKVESAMITAENDTDMSWQNKLNDDSVEKPGPILVDVRTLEEWNEAHLIEAVHFPLEKLQASEPFFDYPKDTSLEIYCRSGRRSEEAVNILKKRGFTNVVNRGGLVDLVNAGYKYCDNKAIACM